MKVYKGFVFVVTEQLIQTKIFINCACYLLVVKMDIDKIIKISIIFLIGFLSANLANFYLVYGLENPFSTNFSLNGTNAPSDFVEKDEIEVYDNKIVIHINDASIGRYAPTGSMKPILDENSNGIRIIPKAEQDIKIGDIVTFKQNNDLIIHRVINKGTDEQGVYFITKGDNNAISDGKIRFKDIKYKTIGVIW